MGAIDIKDSETDGLSEHVRKKKQEKKDTADNGRVISFVGAGGKTTWMYALAEYFTENRAKVIVATTHEEDFLLFVVADQPYLTADTLEKILGHAHPGTLYYRSQLLALPPGQGLWSYDQNISSVILSISLSTAG